MVVVVVVSLRGGFVCDDGDGPVVVAVERHVKRETSVTSVIVRGRLSGDRLAADARLLLVRVGSERGHRWWLLLFASFCPDQTQSD